MANSTLNSNEIQVIDAEELTDIVHCLNIRSARFLNTEPFEQEFDGTDHQFSYHLLAKVRGIPAATMRLKLVPNRDGGVVEWGRLAMLENVPSRTRLKLINALANHSEKVTSRFRIRKIVGYVSDHKLIKFWRRRGFEFEEGVEKGIYGDKEYMPMYRENIFESDRDNRQSY